MRGFVAPSLTGPYEPLNESGLVIGNPSSEPDQAYAWWVLPDPRRADASQARARFGGTFAPPLQLALHGASSSFTAR